MSVFAANELFPGIPLSGRMPALFSGISRDSRKVRPGNAYVALGNSGERPRHLAEARTNGATAIIGDFPEADLVTSHPRWLFAHASSRAHGLHRHCPPVLGITGTKGKSTIAHWLHACLGKGAARIGTIGWHDGHSERPNPQTTPPPEELHAFLAGLDPACPGVAVEVSSHAGDQHRLAGIPLAALAVTGIGHDHLDYHGSVATYVQAKLRIVQLVAPGGLVIVNTADSRADLFAHAAECRQLTVVHLDPTTAPFAVPLPGDFNAWNAQAAVLLAEHLGIPRATAIARLHTASPVPGRLERLAESPITYVDYAHTPESIANVLRAVRTAHPSAPVALVFGCGGDRDPSKRAPMGAAASTANLVILTTDNSRNEDPATIAAEIIAGISGSVAVVKEPDRASAIRLARQRIGPAGVVVVAGKGHETTQIIRGVTYAWDDRAFVRSLA